jgi:branched-chain amino acid transport system substrate-binding protein
VQTLNCLRGRRTAGLTAAAVGAVLVASCSSSSHSSSSSSTTAQSNATTPTSASSSASSASCSSSGVRGVTGSQITVEGLLTVLDFGTGSSAAAKARFDQANADNELPCGRKINYLGYADDGGSPDQDLSDVRRFIDQDHVFAIVPALSPFIESGGVYIDQQHVPTVGWGISPVFCASSNFSDVYGFGFNGCLSPPIPTYETMITGALTAKLFTDQGTSPQGQPGAVIGDDSDSSKSGNVSIAAQLTGAGFKVVYNQNPMPAPPAVASDYSPFVQAIMTSDGGKPPAIVYITSGPYAAFPLSAALRQGGYKGVIVHSTYAPQVVKSAESDQVINTFATTESNSPQMAQIVATLHAAGITSIGQPELAGYYSADMFIQILKKVGPDLTPERFQQVASTYTYSITNVVGPTYYPAGFQTGPPCGEMVYSNGTQWSVSVPFGCYVNTALKKQGSGFTLVPYPSGVS